MFSFILYSFKISESMIGLPGSLIAYVDNRGPDQHRLLSKYAVRVSLSPAFSKKSGGTLCLAFRGAWCVAHGAWRVVRGSEFL